jgi:4-azaleucine resistance transporter AzlC
MDTLTVDLTGQEWKEGLAQAAPIVLGYLPIGLAYGVLAQKAGLSTSNTLLMSLIVYAGSAQFIAVGLLAGGAAPLSVILTTFVVNLRHLLMSAALAPALKGWRQSELCAFAYQLTDESFAVHSAQMARGPLTKVRTLVVNMVAQSAWLLGTWLGAAAGRSIGDVRPWGLDYALPAMFVALLVVQVRDRVHAVVALLAGAISVGLAWSGVQHWGVIAATSLAATAGVVLERWIKRRSP